MKEGGRLHYSRAGPPEIELIKCKRLHISKIILAFVWRLRVAGRVGGRI